MADKLKRIKPHEFARRLATQANESDGAHHEFRMAFFLGAGCSRSSNIPTAGELVQREWLPKLRKLRGEDGEESLEDWARRAIEGYDPLAPARVYGRVIEALFLSTHERQQEIERLCDKCYPGYGYSVLAQLMAMRTGCFNVVLTTNFDDLVADALYLYTDARPLVVHHEALASYIRPSRLRPLVVKLHGDNRLSPKNNDEETRRLDDRLGDAMAKLLHDRGLVFLGYGGYDQGILEALKKLPPQALPFGIYWVNSSEPPAEMRAWLESLGQPAMWVEHRDFDEIMLLFHNELKLQHPNKDRFDRVFARYKETFEHLSARVLGSKQSAVEGRALKEALSLTDRGLGDSWTEVALSASLYEVTNPQKANRIYLEGVKRFSTAVPLLGNYALFLSSSLKKYDEAEDMWQRAVQADPRNALVLGSYASFLKNVRKDYDKAEAVLLKAIEADPLNARNLGKYAQFLADIRQRYDDADRMYRRAIEADADDPVNLANYAGFLLARGRREDGLGMLRDLLDRRGKVLLPSLLVECLFYAYVHEEPEQRRDTLESLKRQISTDVRSPGWDLTPHVQLARANGRPDIAWIEKLAKVITQGADPKILDDWPEWRDV